MSHFDFRRCDNATCGLRYPMAADDPRGPACPRCGGPTTVEATVCHAGRERPAPNSGAPRNTAQGIQVVALIDNVRSLYNVGSFFRTADGAGIGCLHLCGITPTPDNPKLAKTALGAEQSVPWRYHADAVAAARTLQQSGARIVALETGGAATSIFEVPTADRSILVVGNEMAGIDPAILALADLRAAIPMAGLKRSLNVATAFGIAAYALAGRSI